MRERATTVGGVVAVHDDDGEFVVWAYLPYLPAIALPGSVAEVLGARAANR
jgi:hypothetical protein